MTARTLVKNKGAGMSFKARKKAVKDAKAAAKALVRRRGRKAVRALPKIVKSVKRTAATKGTPPSARTKIVRRTAVKVARSPGMTRRLSRPSPKARRLVRRVAVRVRSYTLPGRTRITIAPA